MADFETIQIKFDGGIASRGQLHLYEYSRSQYAFSRFVTIVEQYRRTGEVIEKVTSGRTIDMVVSAPKQGSFGLEVLVPVVQPIVAELKSTSFQALFSYVWAKLLPESSDRDAMATKLAQTELAREKERTRQVVAQQEGETERLRTVADIVKSQTASQAQLVDLIGRALQYNDSRNTEAGYTVDRLTREREMLAADQMRDEELSNSIPQLRGLDSKDIDDLTRKVRPLVNDIGLPLRSSAERCAIGDPANDNRFVRLDLARVRQVNSRSLAEGEVDISALIRAYDRFSGRGKLVSDNFEKSMSFFVEPESRQELRDQILLAMRRGYVSCTCALYLDPAGQITSLILRGIDLGG